MRLLEREGPSTAEREHGTVVTVGTFDGVHRGHVDVIGHLVARAASVGKPSLLVTFEPHPLELVDPARAPLLLTSRDEKLALVERSGVDIVAMLPFDRPLSRLSAEQFVDEVLRARLGMSELLIGHDHGFGRGREGDVETLRDLASSRGFAVDVVPPVSMSGDVPISSTVIRRAVSSGDLASAEEGLGRRYSVSGRVVRGASRGRALGYPTLNVAPDSARKLLPADGVYAVEVATGRGSFDGMMNLGGRPTFGDEERTLEAHLFDADGDFYGDLVQVAFVARLRDVKRFESADALVAQLARDADDARIALTASAESGKFKGFMHFPPSTP